MGPLAQGKALPPWSDGGDSAGVGRLRVSWLRLYMTQRARKQGAISVLSRLCSRGATVDLFVRGIAQLARPGVLLP